MRTDIIDIKLIDFGERYREDYGEIEELVASIKERGLIQPLAVQAIKNDKYEYLLLAGGRRYVACQLAKISTVPVRIYDTELSEKERLSIELAENIYRKDLEWKEEVKLKRSIHDLMTQEHGPKIAKSPEAPGWSATDTAKLVGSSKSSISRDLKLADAVQSVPKLFETAKTKHEADKILKKVEQDIVKQELLKKANKSNNRDKKVITDAYILGDVINELPKVITESVDFCEIDFPYSIDLENNKKHFSKKELTYRDVQKDYISFASLVLKECYRSMKNNSWAIIWFGSEPWFESMYQAIIEVGFKTKRIPGLWIKPNGQTLHPDKFLAHSYEMFFIASKGNPTIIKQGRTNTFLFNQVHITHKIHETERPRDLIKEILETFCLPGSVILSPFLGSGNTILAAKDVGMSAFGYDKEKEYKDRFIVRVHKEN
jgi:ParB/RepB/Spo0J family partition protein